MARPLLLVLVLLAAAAVVWMLWPSATDTPVGDDGGVGRAEASEGDEAPALLRGAGEGASTIPLELRGRGALVGRVQQGGVGCTATVGVYLVETFAGTDPLGMWRGRSFLQRIFDGGVATGSALATTRSDAEGRFAFEGLAAGTYELRATGESGARARATIGIPGAGARVEAVLDLPVGGHTLRGRVVRADGKAFDGFVIVSPGADMESFFAPVPGSLVATPDREGRFTLGGLPSGPVVVSAIVPGRLRIIGAPVVLPREDEFILTVGAGAVTQRGRVLDAADATAIPGASVTAGAGGPGTGFLLVRASTDAEGRFEVAVPEGDGGMFVEAEGYAPHTGEWAGEGGEAVEIRLLRTATLTGRVVTGEAAEGVENVWVFALPLERGFSLAFPAAARTGASGRFELPGIVPGAVTVFAMGGGWTTPELGKVDPDGYNPLARTLAPGESQEIEIQVEAAGRLEGRVTTQTGRPVAGAVLHLKSPFFAFRTLAQTAVFGGGVGSAVADGDGRYAIDTLIPGLDYRVEATAVGSPPYRSDKLSATTGRTERLDIVLDAARWLDLRVTSSDGSALAGAEVTVAVKRGGPDYAGIPGRRRTDADGRARVGPLPPGAIGVHVKATDHLEVEGWIEVAGQATEGDLRHELTLERGLRVGGTVVVPEGASSPRVEITVRSRRPGRGPWVWKHTSAEADGTWSLGGLPSGGLEIEAELQWEGEHYEATAQIEAGDEGVRLELRVGSPSGAGLVVKILDADDKPVAAGNARMYTRSKNSSGTHGQSFSSGQATFHDTSDADELWIQAWARAGSGWGDALIGPIPERSGEVVVRLPRARTIEGVVTDTHGKGVGGIRIETHLPSPLSDRNHGRGDRFTLTAEDGSFELRDLGDGTYAVLVKAPHTYAPVPSIETKSGARDLRIRLTESASAVVTVLDYDGRPVAGARVGVSGGQRSVYFWTDAKGVAQVQGLAPDLNHELSVNGPEGRDDLHSWSEDDWTPADATVQLRRAYVIAGVVRDLSGKPVPSVMVQHGLESQPGSWSGRMSEADGAFRLTGLEQGAYRLRASVGTRHGPGEEGSFLVVQAGTTDVVLRIDPGITLTVRVRPWTGDEWGASMQLREQREGSGASYASEEVDGEGRVVFRGCSADRRYDVFLGNLPGHEFVLGRDLKPGAEEIVLARQTGGTITGRLHLPTGVTVRHLHVSVRVLGFHVGGEVEESGTFTVHGVPPGTWEASGGLRSKDGEYYTGSVQAAAGAEVDVQLKQR